MIIDHIAIRADNIEKLSKWYQNTIGATVTHTDTHYVRLTTSNSTIAIIDKNKYPCNHIGVLVDSLDDLPEDGKRIEHRDGTVGVYCEDPEGNFVEFIYYTEDLRQEFLTYAHTTRNGE
jgi:catechol-2,3-dioxygenase